VKDHTLIHVK